MPGIESIADWQQAVCEDLCSQDQNEGSIPGELRFWGRVWQKLEDFFNLWGFLRPQRVKVIKGSVLSPKSLSFPQYLVLNTQSSVIDLQSHVFLPQETQFTAFLSQHTHCTLRIKFWIESGLEDTPQLVQPDIQWRSVVSFVTKTLLYIDWSLPVVGWSKACL